MEVGVGARLGKAGRDAVVRRLQHEFKQLSKNPLSCVSAAPLESNIFVWHVNLNGAPDTPCDGGMFHLRLVFPEEYPAQPPALTALTELPHPNVLRKDGRVCLAILSKHSSSDSLLASKPHDPQQHQQQHQRRFGAAYANGGWSPENSVASVLAQLQTFLGVEGDPSEEIQHAVRKSRYFVCRACGHSPTKVHPPLECLADGFRLWQRPETTTRTTRTTRTARQRQGRSATRTKATQHRDIFTITDTEGREAAAASVRGARGSVLAVRLDAGGVH